MTQRLTNSLTQRLANWYSARCNEEWEHQYGIKIGTIDNPGWSLSVDLSDTPLERRQFLTIREERTSANWIHCSVSNQVFCGFGGPANLDEIIQKFLEWAEA